MVFVALALSASWAQTTIPPQPIEVQSDDWAPADQDAASQIMQRTPVSQPDGPFLDPLPESRSLFLAGVYVSDSLETNTIDSIPNSTQIYSFTRILGSLNYLRIRPRSETAIDYRGGGYFREGAGSSHKQLQHLQAGQRFLWPKTALTLSDSFSNLPGGSFGSEWFGGASAYDLGTTVLGAALAPDPGIAAFVGATSVGGFGQQTIRNLTVVDVTHVLTRRSSFAVAGAYGLTDYLDDNPHFINDQQISTLASYDYTLSPLSGIGVVYGFRSFHFPEAYSGNIVTQVVQLDYSRRLSRRLRMQAGAGPEFSRIVTPAQVPGVTPPQYVNLLTHQINVSAFASLAYSVRRATFGVSYDRLVTNGSGLYAGANTNIAQMSISRSFQRAWTGNFDAGYVRLSRIGQSQALVPGNSYQYGFVGFGMRRRLRRINIFGSYQFNVESFNTSFCNTPACTGLARRNTALIGIDWHTRPFHLDSGNSREEKPDATEDNTPNINDSQVPPSDE
jgi:hypothetical protein